MHAHLKLSALALLGTLLAAGLSAEESLAQVRMEAEAVAGEPFGAGRLIIQASPDMLPQVLGVDGLVLTERNGRVLYPTIEEAPLGGLFGDLLGRPQRITVRFLFTGDDPLKLDLQARARHSGTVRITSDAVTYGRLLRGWWRGYSARPRLFKKRCKRRTRTIGPVLLPGSLVAVVVL